MTYIAKIVELCLFRPVITPILGQFSKDQMANDRTLGAQLSRSVCYFDVIDSLSDGTVTGPAFDALPHIQKINEEIGVHLEAVRALNSRKNAHIWINRFPPELLARILILCAPQKDSYGRKALQALLAISHVCGHWRALTLETPVYWSNILISCPEWTGEMLARSREAEISVDVDCAIQSDPSPALLSGIMDCVPRMIQLRLSLSIISMEQISKRLCQPAPRLLEIKLANDRPSDEGYFLVPSDIFGGIHPRIHTIFLRGCSVRDWDSPLFACLSSLTLSNISPATRPTVIQIFDILRRSPSLGLLVLKDCLPPSSLQEEAVVDAHLTQLSYLKLEGSASEISRVFPRIHFPTTAKLQILCVHNAPESVASEGVTLLSQVQAHYTSNGRSLFRAMTMANRPHRCFQVLCWTEDVPVQWHNTSLVFLEALKSCHVQFFLRATGSIPASSHTALWKMLPLESLYSMALHHLETSSQLAWMEILPPCKRLNSLTLSGQPPAGLIEAFGSTAVSDAQDDRQFPVIDLGEPGNRRVLIHDITTGSTDIGTPMLPRLRTLTMRNMDLKAKMHWATMNLRESLISSLGSRATMDSMLGTLDIRGVQGVEAVDDVDLLGNHVTALLWGAKQGSNGDSSSMLDLTG